MDKYVNNIEWWLKKKLQDRRITTHKFAARCGLTSATIYRWYAGAYQPSERNMEKVCNCLSRLPVVLKDGSQRYEYVPLSEGLRQFSPE